MTECKREDVIVINLQTNPERGGNPNKDRIRIPTIRPSAVESDTIDANSIILLLFIECKVNSKEDVVKQYTIK